MVSNTENKTREFKTQNKIINNSEFYFIAEIGHNHQGEIEKAFELIRKAKEAGAKTETISIIELEEIPLTYLPSGAVRLHVKAVGDLF